LEADGGYVDNLILVGAPINKDLYDALRQNANIGQMIVIRPPGDPIYAGISDTQLVKDLGQLRQQWRDTTGHFYYSATGQLGQQRDAALARYLYSKGVR
jgi:hypothetical protein